MDRVKEVALIDTTDEGQFRILKAGEKDVDFILLVNAPEGVFYTVKGDKPGRHFIPMHMISSMEMIAEVTN